MPSTWKTSLAFDMKLPGDIDFTVEGIYSRDYNPVVVSNTGYKPSETTVTLAQGMYVIHIQCIVMQLGEINIKMYIC